MFFVPAKILSQNQPRGSKKIPVGLNRKNKAGSCGTWDSEPRGSRSIRTSIQSSNFLRREVRGETESSLGKTGSTHCRLYLGSFIVPKVNLTPWPVWYNVKTLRGRDGPGPWPG